MVLKTVLKVTIVAVSIGGILPCLSSAQSSRSDSMVVPSGASDSIQILLHKPIKIGEAYIWYLLHCGYAVKTPTRLLIFDYISPAGDTSDTNQIQSLATGRIYPEEIKDLKVYVFVTHSHEDHYDSVILEWQEQVEDITYIFGWQATDDSNHYHMVNPREAIQVDNMEIYTINCRSGVPEVAFLIKTDGLTIFFQGDYKSDSMADIDYLTDRCDTVDMAFLGAHTRKWSEASNRIKRIMERLQPRVVFPMHYGGKELTYKLFAQECASDGFPFVIKCPEEPGDMFYYQR